MAYTADQIAEAIRVSKEQGFSEADILKGLASYGVTAGQAAAALAAPASYTPAQVTQAIASSRAAGFTDADIATGLERYRVPVAQTAGAYTPTGTAYTPAQVTQAIETSRAAGFTDADIATGLERYRVPVAQTAGAYTPTGTAYTPAQVTQAIETSRAQGFSDADISVGLQRYLPTPAAVTTALTANPRPATTTALNTTQTAFAPIVRPTAPRQPTYTQTTPASFTQTAIANTPYKSVYTPSQMQQATDAQIQAAMQTSNPYMSLMSLTPQRTMPMSYAGPAGVTAANTNLGGFDSSIYNPAAATGLLTTPGAGGYDGVNNSGDQRGPGTGNTADGTGQTAYGMLGNLAGEAQRAGFNTLGGFLASGIPVGAAYKGGSFTTADLAALGNRDAIAAMTAQNQAIAQDAEQQSSSSPFDGGTGEGRGAAYDKFKGGLITPLNIRGPNPPGPDDGNTNIGIGEYVIRKSAVKKYGSNIFEQINAGKIPAQRLKSLLE
jgi:hypothetical protein